MNFKLKMTVLGVSPAIERLTHEGETPALHSEVQKQAAFGIIPDLRKTEWSGVSRNAHDPVLDGFVLEEMFLDDAVALFGGHSAIPESLGIDDHPWAAAADTEAGCLGS